MKLGTFNFLSIVVYDYCRLRYASYLSMTKLPSCWWLYSRICGELSYFSTALSFSNILLAAGTLYNSRDALQWKSYTIKPIVPVSRLPISIASPYLRIGSVVSDHSNQSIHRIYEAFCLSREGFLHCVYQVWNASVSGTVIPYHATSRFLWNDYQEICEHRKE